MSMKRKAEEAGRIADELYEQHFGGKKEEPAPVVEPKPEGQPPEPAVGEPSPQDALSQPEAGKVETPEPAKEPAPETPPKKEVDWEAKFKAEEHKRKVIQGKYEKESEERRTLVELVKGLKAQQESMSEALAVLSSKDKDAERTERLQTIEQLKTEYPSMYAGIVAQIKEELASDRASISSEIKEVKEKVEEHERAQQASSQEVFFSMLSGMVPDWQEVNQDPEFQEWLQGREKYARTNRFTQLGEAYADGKGDAKAVAEFFNGFKAYRDSAKAERDAAVATATAKTQARVTPEPVKPTPPKVEPKPAEREYTTAFINAFYRDYSRGVKRSNYYRDLDEAKKIEYEIEKAGREGRVIRSKNIAP